MFGFLWIAIYKSIFNKHRSPEFFWFITTTEAVIMMTLPVGHLGYLVEQNLVAGLHMFKQAF